MAADPIQTLGLTKMYKDLSKSRTKSLDNLDLTVRSGEVFGFLGRNGAGKTTTIKMLCGLVKPSSGDALIFGESIRDRRARRHIGYLPEQPYFYEYLTPRETIDFYGRLQGLDATARAETWERLAAQLELDPIADRRIKGFSKGMRQRIGFAVALVGDPPLLILDEPMSGLDPVGRRQIRELILQCRDAGKTVFFSSHVLSDVELICNRIAILSEGKLRQTGALDDLLGSAETPCEIVAINLSTELVSALQKDAESHRHFEGKERFVFANQERANEAARALLNGGGELLELTPIKTRLEEYFIREQGGGRPVEGAIS